ncbi:MAG TPA: DUF3368 domain-containing protein [Longimicrobiaceae bacterium]|nr:DUF3368 domain-containing protein [Longimicrobiaceae bacterium]
MFGPVLAPPAVVQEFGHAPEWLSTTSVSSSALVAALGLVLGPGEAEAIALAAERQCRVILDDHQARSAAARLGLEVIGTVGILLRAKRAGLVPEVGPLLDALDGVGFRVDPGLRRRALELANET